MILKILITALACVTLSNSEEVNIWGPGLSPEKITMPARYFFIKVMNSKDSVTQEKLYVKISGDSSFGTCRIWMNILNRKDGSFIIRYRLYEACTNFKIVVKYKNLHVGSSPYLYAGIIYNEDCDCPEKEFDTWAKQYGCPDNIEQLNRDMRPFKDVNMTNILQDVLQNYHHPGSMSLCHYVIKGNELHRKCYGQHVGFHIFSDAILLSVMRKVVLPDQSFFINLGDWPLVKKTSKLIPLFSWCGSTETMDIVLPTYDLTESTLENMGRVMLDMLSVQGNIETQWDEKVPQAFWRGRDSCKERLKLVDISREHPTLYNVSLTNFFFFRDREETYGPKVPHISFFKFFDFKYQINVDGTVAAYRFPYLLVGNSLVLKQESPYYEHFYHQLQPGVHYIPFKRDLSDLTEKLQWAMENDDEARVISKNGRNFATKNLMPKDIICYYAVAFKEWAKRVADPGEVYEGMEKVQQKEKAKQGCTCSHTSSKDEL